MMTQTKTEYRRAYLQRWEKIRYARTKGFNDRLAALVGLKLIERGLTADEVREALYLAAADGVFGVMMTAKQKIEVIR